ncbi:MAG: hypothetical protein LAO55_06985 [Acidobacteriia bacterium]|nr:hypothetical protein [Terriglobia bacterium]
MPCNLKKDTSGLFDALTTKGSTATIFVTSDATPATSLTAVALNGADVPVGDDGKAKLPALQRGTNVLDLTVEGAGLKPGDDVHLVEDCGGGTTSDLKTKFVGDTPAGADPVVGFRIHGS